MVVEGKKGKSLGREKGGGDDSGGSLEEANGFK